MLSLKTNEREIKIISRIIRLCEKTICLNDNLTVSQMLKLLGGNGENSGKNAQNISLVNIKETLNNVLLENSELFIQYVKVKILS